ncbi:glycosyltransferase [Arthrobacter alpinus]|uniref:glycosyltransferase n=1 Tax=Arthrobacter alpinus TaxID=656366 RepID=UPI0016455669|nr:glycosyltransferase [Arthrobacter alpinus]
MNNSQSEAQGVIRASVCMASYRGALYIQEQIESVLVQLDPADELIVVDDASGDNTVEIVKGFLDPRIHLIEVAQNQGYVRSFEQAVLASRGKFIFLADQDDLWLPGRLELMLETLQTSGVVASNFDVLGGGPRDGVPELRAADSTHYLRNVLGTVIGYRPYYGCGMAMTREQAQIFTPIPGYIVESHDLWLALCGNVGKTMQHLEEPTLLRRLHEENVTPRGWRSIGTILRARIMILRALAEAIRRNRATRI